MEEKLNIIAVQLDALNKQMVELVREIKRSRMKRIEHLFNELKDASDSIGSSGIPGETSCK